MLFSKEFLRNDETGTVSSEITGKSRWADHYRRVFQHEGKFYETCYRVGSTEMQEEMPYENDPDEIECKEVFAVEKTITVYE